MVQFDNQYRQVKLKVVYYGPALGGKTTCLQFIHRTVDPKRRTKLYALNTASDRTLFFDLLSLDLGQVRGYRLKLQLFTVPGQVQYDATRRAVLAGADGVVFVADSQRDQEKANTASLSNLKDNLQANGLDPQSIPLVFLYNKQDLPDLTPVPDLEKMLGASGHRGFEAVATVGTNVIEAFAAITELTVLSVAERLGLSSQPETTKRLAENVRAAFGNVGSAVQPSEDGGSVVIRPASDAPTLGQEQLVGEAVRANMAMAELNARLDHLTLELERRVAQMRSVNELGREMAQARSPDQVASQFLERFLTDLHVERGALLATGDGHALIEALSRGLEADPLLVSAGGEPVACSVMTSRKPTIIRLAGVDEATVASTPHLREMRRQGCEAAVAVPLFAQDRPVGVATAYANSEGGSFDDEDLELAAALAATGAAALANAGAWSALEEMNRSLEKKVAARTAELETALADARALAEALEDRRAELENANRQLAELEALKGSLLNRVAHELNTPVTSIRTAASILSRHGELAPAKSSQFVAIIQQEASRLTELIASALEATLLGLTESVTNPAPIAVAQLLRQVVAPLKGEIERRGIALQVKIAAGLVNVDGDVGQLEAGLRAIVKNAVEFNRDGGSIQVTAVPVQHESGAFVEIRVEDSGSGISTEDLPHVSEVLWQGGKILTGKPRGLGLGLAVARRVADNHGGSLQIQSVVDTGSTVTMLLPARAVVQA